MSSPSPSRLKRCAWVSVDPLYVAYHDDEWGVPVHDDRALFEKLLLDGFQAGLSWITILRKRDAFRRAFMNFEPERLVKFGAADITRLMNDAAIVRNRAKIEGSVASARAWLAVQEEGGFARFCWQFVDGKPRQNRWSQSRQIPSETAESRALSKALKARGFTFVGPTIVYAFMQAVGMVNDHLTGCFRYTRVRKLS
jgi:DNA-3-methyladenine glycosylase I